MHMYKCPFPSSYFVLTFAFPSKYAFMIYDMTWWGHLALFTSSRCVQMLTVLNIFTRKRHQMEMFRIRCQYANAKLKGKRVKFYLLPDPPQVHWSIICQDSHFKIPPRILSALSKTKKRQRKVTQKWRLSGSLQRERSGSKPLSCDKSIIFSILGTRWSWKGFSSKKGNTLIGLGSRIDAR